MDSRDRRVFEWAFPRRLVWMQTLVVACSATPLRGADNLPVSRSAAEHWAFQPVHRPTIPTAGDYWGRSPIDSFVQARLREQHLQPAPEADRRTLMRRVSFVLTGLPPSPENVNLFVGDPAPDAYERLVDRLLASPHFGEHFAQMWLDVVRYAETEGYEYDNYLPGLWRYRDYVIRSFNNDKPYDEFLREQLAGDERDGADHELLVAAGFHRLGAVRRNAGNQNVASSRNEVLTERTNIIGSALLGMTIGCCRCHDHKFDPLPQADYYRLQAFLASTFEADTPLADQQEQEEWTATTESIKKQLEVLKERMKEADFEEEERLRLEMAELEEQLPPPLPTICTIREDPRQRTPVHVLQRGLPEKPGEPVGMRLPGVLCRFDAQELSAATPRPRTILAEQITDPNNPLTARVFANRLWAYVFGQGIVNTPNDFGRNGDRPSHPLLLDYLASELVEGGWRIKPLVRQLVTSSTFRQSALNTDDTLANEIDPENRLLWRFSRRRLTAEETRDAMLTVAGRLNERMGGQSVIIEVEPDLVELLYKPSQWKVTPDRREHDRRSIYLLAKRNLRLPFMEVFDQPDLQTSCARRESSTHALQALELLNGRLSNELAEAFAERLRAEAGDDKSRQVNRAFALALGRPPTAEERSAAEIFLSAGPLEEFALAMFNLNGFLYVD